MQLLGHDSNDIDVALSDMMGLAFAEHLAAYAEAKGVESGKISKIAQNPDQSKHLETATLKLAGLDVDLVNLRSEEYAENSRIPTDIVRIPFRQPSFLLICCCVSDIRDAPTRCEKERHHDQRLVLQCSYQGGGGLYGEGWY